MTDKPQTKKPYTGTYRSYINRIVIRIMQESAQASKCFPSKNGGLMNDREWRRIIKLGADEFMKAVKVRP